MKSLWSIALCSSKRSGCLRLLEMETSCRNRIDLTTEHFPPLTLIFLLFFFLLRIHVYVLTMKDQGH